MAAPWRCSSSLRALPGPALFTPWAVDLLARVAPQPGERVLDVACGTGIVARPLQYNPYLRALADALEHHITPEAGAVMRAPCSLGDAEAPRALLATAGFRDIRLHIVIITIRHPAVAEFLAGQLAAAPVAVAVAALDTAARTALLSEIRATLQPYTDDAGLAVPYETLSP